MKISEKAVHIIGELLSLPEPPEEGLAPWIKVIGVLASKIKTADQQKVLIPYLQELLNNKNTQETRKVGQRILFTAALNLGEEGLNKEPTYLKMMKSVFHDNNYKLRRDGVIFFKEYLIGSNAETICKSSRFEDTYLPELLDFCEDEDLHI